MIPKGHISLRAPAKINWTLQVLGRRPDGFHEIDTLMQAVSLEDQLFLEARRREACEIFCASGDVPTDGTNLVARAWDLMRREFPGRVGGARVRLMKRIPVGAGLGGGSSDAAAMLVGINRLWGLRLSKPRLVELAGRLGSDVPFFIHGGTARAQGRGEIISPIRSRLPAVSVVIVFPGFPSPTAAAYKKLHAPKFPNARPRPHLTERAARAAGRGSLPELLKCRCNDFDTVLTRSDRRYQVLKKRMTAAGLAGVMLTGSGSACYGIAENRATASAARETLMEWYDEVFVSTTQARAVVVWRP